MDADRLKTIKVFDALGEGALHRLATFASQTSVAAGGVVMREGDYAHELIAIEEGEAEVLRDGRRVAVLGPGECFGEMALLNHTPRTATVVAITPMRLVTFTVTDLRRVGAAIDLELDAVLREHQTEMVS